MAFFSGAGHTLYFINQPPFMMRLSNAQNRTLLFSLNFGLVTLSGAGGNLLAGYLPSVFGNLLGISAESAMAYRMVLLSAVLLSFFTLVPLTLIRNYPERLRNDGEQDSPSKILNSLRTTITKPINLKLLLPNLPLGFGAAILIPYMNLYFAEKYGVTDVALGVIFSLSSVLIGIGSLVGPRLAIRFNSKIKAVVFSQGLSMVFLVVLGLTTSYQVAVIAFLLRGSLMNMAVPLFDAFTMENVQEREQATVVSLRELFWQIGWTFGPYISGVVQETRGFTPLFFATTVLYLLSTGSIWLFFKDVEKNKSSPM
jgi:predicted MFS family arabinose efflux permease